MQKTILIIEDEYAIRKDLVTILSLSDFNVIDAHNGRIGVEKASQYLPDLIISDIMMPEIDGYGVITELQKIPETAKIPFLFLSAKSSKNDIREGMSLGADDFITKPYDINDLLEAVNTRLKKSQNIESQYNRKIEEFRSNVQMSMPHEIRTPLNIILGMTDFLKKNFHKMEQDDISEILTNISDSGQRLNRLFENYLFYANLELISTSFEDVKNLLVKKTQLAEVYISDLSTVKANNYNRLNDLVIDTIECEIHISESYLQKIIEETVDNAFKFSKTGTKVNVNSYINGYYYTIEVCNKGRGMTPEQIKNIGAYVQFERKLYEQQGNGLGLTIVKKVVELHKGRFEIESEIGKFTKIILQIPVVRN